MLARKAKTKKRKKKKKEKRKKVIKSIFVNQVNHTLFLSFLLISERKHFGGFREKTPDFTTFFSFPPLNYSNFHT